MILLFLLALPIIFTYLLYHTKLAKPRLPPGPPRLPFIGNLHQIASAGNLPFYFWQLSQKYGPIIHLKLGQVNVIVVSSPDLAKEVLKTQDSSFCSRPTQLAAKKLSYNFKDMGSSPYNDYWRQVRKITNTHLFSLKKTQSFRGIREDEVSRMISKISGSCGSVVNMSEMCMALSSRLICRIAFGKRYEEHGSEMRRFDELLHDAQAAMARFFVSDYFPCLSFLDKLTGSIDWLHTLYMKLDVFYQELINEHLENKRETKDVLDVLIELREDKSSSVDLDWDHIKALLMDVFIAATDATVE